MRKVILSFLFFAFSTCVVFGQATQRGRITGKVTDEQSQPIHGATAELLRSKDSSLVKVAITDKAGTIEFENIRFGSYFIRVSHINLLKSFSPVIILSAETNAITVADISLKAAPKELQGVQVTARKPFIQQMTDRIVVNVENSVINAGSSAFDVLERSPGVLIDANDNLSMRGKAGVIIMIDGKPSPMSGSDLVNYLRSLPSSAIERIELITNPFCKI